MATNKHSVTLASGTTETRNSKTRVYGAAMLVTVTERVWEVEIARCENNITRANKQIAEYQVVINRFDQGCPTKEDTKWGWTRETWQGFINGCNKRITANEAILAALHGRDAEKVRDLGLNFPDVGAQGIWSWHRDEALAQKAVNTHHNRHKSSVATVIKLVDGHANLQEK